MDKKTIRYILGSLMSGLLCYGIIYFGDELTYGEGWIIGFLFFGPGLIFALTILLITYHITEWWRKVLFTIISGAAYFAAVWTFLYFQDSLDSRLSLTIASIVGAGLVSVGYSLISRTINEFTIIASLILGAIIGFITPIPDSNGGWGPELPNIMILFPLWQACIGGLFSLEPLKLETKNIPTTPAT